MKSANLNSIGQILLCPSYVIFGSEILNNTFDKKFPSKQFLVTGTCVKIFGLEFFYFTQRSCDILKCYCNVLFAPCDNANYYVMLAGAQSSTKDKKLGGVSGSKTDGKQQDEDSKKALGKKRLVLSEPTTSVEQTLLSYKLITYFKIQTNCLMFARQPVSQ